MREELKGMRLTFTAVFERFGVHKYLAHVSVPALHLRDVRDAQGEIVARRALVNSNAEFVALDLKEGDLVQFDAHVTARGKFAYPNKVKRVVAEPRVEELPLFKNSG